MGDSNTDPPMASRVQLSERDDADGSPDRIDSGTDRGTELDLEDHDESAKGADASAALPAPDADRCAGCGTTIGPQEYRLSRVIEDDRTRIASHYCSEDCFPDERPGASTDRSDEPRDWSYCR